MKLNPTLLKLISLLQAFKNYAIDEGILTESSGKKTDWLAKTKEYYYSLDKGYFHEAGISQNEWYFWQLLGYKITTEIDKSLYTELGKFTFPNEEETKENIVSSYFFFMWNAWCKEECKIVFGGEYQHFWDKWCGICKVYKVYSATERFYAELSDSYRVRLVNHACEKYDGNRRRK